MGLPPSPSHLYGCSSWLRDIDDIYMQCYRIWNVAGHLDQEAQQRKAKSFRLRTASLGRIPSGTKGEKYFAGKTHRTINNQNKTSLTWNLARCWKVAKQSKKRRERSPKGSFYPNRRRSLIRKRNNGEKDSCRRGRSFGRCCYHSPLVTRDIFLRVMFGFNKKHRSFYDNSFTRDLSGNSVGKSKKLIQPSKNDSWICFT